MDQRITDGLRAEELLGYVETLKAQAKERFWAQLVDRCADVATMAGYAQGLEDLSAKLKAVVLEGRRVAEE